MKRTLTALAFLAAAAAPAIAADIPVKARPMAPVMAPVFNWTGFYIGGHVGYGWADKSWTETTALFGVSHKADGFLGGGQVGFNYQINTLVLGLEGDFSWADLDGGSTVLFGAAAPVSVPFNTKVEWTATLTGRVGLAFDTWMLYGKGGVAWAHDRYSTSFYTFPLLSEVTETRVGWTVGAGVEWAFAQQWSAKLEYNYMDFGSENVSFFPTTTMAIEQEIHAVKFGINYRFGGGPIVARY
jgi:outer membrane immunogenic protein